MRILDFALTREEEEEEEEEQINFAPRAEQQCQVLHIPLHCICDAQNVYYKITMKCGIGRWSASASASTGWSCFSCLLDLVLRNDFIP